MGKILCRDIQSVLVKILKCLVRVSCARLFQVGWLREGRRNVGVKGLPAWVEGKNGGGNL